MKRPIMIKIVKVPPDVYIQEMSLIFQFDPDITHPTSFRDIFVLCLIFIYFLILFPFLKNLNTF